MCDFCTPKKGYVDPLFWIKSDSISTPESCETLAATDAHIIEEDSVLNVGVYLFGRIVLCDEIPIKYCPICGRRLYKRKEEECE